MTSKVYVVLAWEIGDGSRGSDDAWVIEKIFGSLGDAQEYAESKWDGKRQMWYDHRVETWDVD